MNKRILYTISALIIAVVVVFSLVSQFTLRSRIRQQDEMISRFITQTRDDLGFINESQDMIKQNALQLRQYMNLPALNFPERDSSTTNESENSEASSFELAAYDAADYLKNYNSEFEQIGLFNQFLDEPAFLRFLDIRKLELKKRSTFGRSLCSADGTDFFSLLYNAEEQQIEVRPGLSGQLEKFSEADDRFIAFLSRETDRQIEAYRRVDDLNSSLSTLTRSTGFHSLLKEKDIRMGSSLYKGKNLSIPLLKKDNSVLAVLTTNTENSTFRLNKQDYSSPEELAAAVGVFFEETDLRTDAESLDALVQNEMVTLLKDTAFSAHLEKLGYTAGSVPREDNDYIYYDLIDQSGNTAGAYALQKEFGELYLMDRDDIPVRSLKTFTPGHELTFPFQKSNQAGASDQVFLTAEGSDTFLMIGSHEHNADTMIIVHCDSISNEIKMLSIPRDLYYKGLKINSIYRNYGPARLASELSSITGLNISKYVAIDMYAFIDVINLLGGIDVELDESLIDPTYKVRENGKWSTLYYPAGEHHLDGIAALRIARSRHSSSDFERAVRQQKVIAALRDSLSGLGLNDISRIYDFMQIAGKYLTTNLNTADMVRYFLSYKDYKINGQNVLNTDNVLYATYTNLYRLTEDEQQKALEDPGFYKGGWIVLPKNNDWSQIKMFIQSIMTSS